MAETKLTHKQLLALTDTEGLTIEQIQMRTALIKMQSEEKLLDLANAENEKHLAQKSQSERQWKAKCADIKAQQAEEERIQTLCAHQTGGKDRQGFYAGDGDIYGYCVSRQTLPTGETYGLCARCAKEWHHPNLVERYFPGHSEKLSLRKAVTLGLFPLAEYSKMEREYQAMLRFKARTFEPLAGEIPASVQFRIPALRERLEREGAEFAAYLDKLPAAERTAAGVPA